VKNFMKEFKDFIAAGNMIELAIAVILAGVVGAAIKSFTEDIVMQIVGAIVGKPDFSQLTFKLGKGVIFYGRFINALIALVLTGFVLFMMIRAYNKMRKPVEAAPPGPNEIDLLTEIRDSLRSRS
jgi:large conductance mechanosensitive channel